MGMSEVPILGKEQTEYREIVAAAEHLVIYARKEIYRAAYASYEHYEGSVSIESPIHIETLDIGDQIVESRESIGGVFVTINPGSDRRDNYLDLGISKDVTSGKMQYSVICCPYPELVVEQSTQSLNTIHTLIKQYIAATTNIIWKPGDIQLRLHTAHEEAGYQKLRTTAEALAQVAHKYIYAGVISTGKAWSGSVEISLPLYTESIEDDLEVESQQPISGLTLTIISGIGPDDNLMLGLSTWPEDNHTLYDLIQCPYPELFAYEPLNTLTDAARLIQGYIATVLRQ
jgi:hypothetical protein